MNYLSFLHNNKKDLAALKNKMTKTKKKIVKILCQIKNAPDNNWISATLKRVGGNKRFHYIDIYCPIIVDIKKVAGFGQIKEDDYVEPYLGINEETNNNESKAYIKKNTVSGYNKNAKDTYYILTLPKDYYEHLDI